MCSGQEVALPRACAEWDSNKDAVWVLNSDRCVWLDLPELIGQNQAADGKT